MNERPRFHTRPKRASATGAGPAALSVAVALAVLVLKGVAWRLTGSVALFSDALESIVNVAAAVTAFAMVRIAARPADEDHPYGHSKAEYFSSVFEGVLIVLAAIGIVVEAAGRLRAPMPIERVSAGLAVSLLASLLNATLGFYLLREGRKLRSPALRADGAHVLTDVATSAGVIVGTALAAATGTLILDPLIAMLVAVLIVATGSKLVRESISGLMDAGVSPDVLAKIEAVLVRAVPDTMAPRHVRTRCAGSVTFVDLDLSVPGDLTVAEAHEVCDRIEDAVALEIEGAHVTIHVEPNDQSTRASTTTE